MCRLRGLVIFCCLSLGLTVLPSTAHAVLVWDWFFFPQATKTVAPNQSPISFEATIFNSFFSNEHLTQSRLAGAGWFRDTIPATYDFEFGVPGTISFFDQFAGMDLAPGDSLGFVFGTFTQVAGPASPGTYQSLGGIGLRIPDSESVDSKQHAFGLNVTSPSTPIIPEPTSFILFSAALVLTICSRAIRKRSNLFLPMPTQ